MQALIISDFDLGSTGRLADFHIRVGQTFDQLHRASFDPTNYTQCAYQSAALGSGETKMFTCDQPISGRFVTVHVPTAKSGILTLCEVAVYELNQGMLLGCKAQVTTSFPERCQIKNMYMCSSLTQVQ